MISIINMCFMCKSAGNIPHDISKVFNCGNTGIYISNLETAMCKDTIVLDTF